MIALVAGLMRPVLSALLNARIPSAQRATILSLQSLIWTLMLAVLEPSIFTLAAKTRLSLGLWRRAAAVSIPAAEM